MKYGLFALMPVDVWDEMSGKVERCYEVSVCKRRNTSLWHELEYLMAVSMYLKEETCKGVFREGFGLACAGICFNDQRDPHLQLAHLVWY